MALTVNRQKHFIQMPFIARLRATATQPIGVILPKLPAPLADGFVGHCDAAFEQEFLHVAIAQGEAIGEPDAMTDNFTGKAVVLVTLGVGRRGYVWAGGNYVMAQAGWSTKGAAPRRAWPRRAPSAVTQTRRARSAWSCPSSVRVNTRGLPGGCHK